MERTIDELLRSQQFNQDRLQLDWDQREECSRRGPGEANWTGPGEANWTGRGRNPLRADEGDVLWSARGLNPVETVDGDVLWPESGRNPPWLDRREGAFVRRRRRRFGPE